MVRERTIKGIDITLPSLQVKKELGYKEKTVSTPQIEEMISELINMASSIIKPRGRYVIIEYMRIKGKNVNIGGRLQFQSHNIAELLRDQQQVTLMAVTVGKQLEDKVTSLFEEKDLTKATILDAIGSVATEQTANQITKKIRQEAIKRGLPHLTMRYSPGYGDLSLQVQPKLLEIVKGEEIGIRTTSCYFLSPQKSITALIGLGKERIPSTRSL